MIRLIILISLSAICYACGKIPYERVVIISSSIILNKKPMVKTVNLKSVGKLTGICIKRMRPYKYPSKHWGSMQIIENNKQIIFTIYGITDKGKKLQFVSEFGTKDNGESGWLYCLGPVKNTTGMRIIKIAISSDRAYQVNKIIWISTEYK